MSDSSYDPRQFGMVDLGGDGDSGEANKPAEAAPDVEDMLFAEDPDFGATEGGVLATDPDFAVSDGPAFEEPTPTLKVPGKEFGDEGAVRRRPPSEVPAPAAQTSTDPGAGSADQASSGVVPPPPWLQAGATRRPPPEVIRREPSEPVERVKLKSRRGGARGYYTNTLAALCMAMLVLGAGVAGGAYMYLGMESEILGGLVCATGLIGSIFTFVLMRSRPV